MCPSVSYVVKLQRHACAYAKASATRVWFITQKHHTK